jgi:hypothetical protein
MRISTLTALVALGLLGGAAVAARAAEAGSGYVLFRDAMGMLARSTPEGRSAGTLTTSRLSDKDRVAMLAGGRQYAVFRSRSASTDTVTIYDMATGQRQYSQDVPVHTDIAGPLFGKPDVFLLRSFVGASDNNRAFVADLRTGALVGNLATQGATDSIDVLPDGRVYRINDKTGRISVADADGAWRDIGALRPPPDLKIGTWKLSHAGDKLAVSYGRVDRIGVYRSDIWVANIDGSGQYRLTNQWGMKFPLWSPDDRRVAFQIDTRSSLVGAGLQGGGLTGQCSYWQVPVEAANVAGITPQQTHPIATEILVSAGGAPATRICKVVGWER